MSDQRQQQPLQADRFVAGANATSAQVSPFAAKSAETFRTRGSGPTRVEQSECFFIVVYKASFLNLDYGM